MHRAVRVSGLMVQGSRRGRIQCRDYFEKCFPTLAAI